MVLSQSASCRGPHPLCTDLFLRWGIAWTSTFPWVSDDTVWKIGAKIPQFNIAFEHCHLYIGDLPMKIKWWMFHTTSYITILVYQRVPHFWRLTKMMDLVHVISVPGAGSDHGTCRRLPPTDSRFLAGINGNFRILNWRYLLYIRPI